MMSLTLLVFLKLTLWTVANASALSLLIGSFAGLLTAFATVISAVARLIIACKGNEQSQNR